MTISTHKSLSGLSGGSDWFLRVLIVSVFQPIVDQMSKKAKRYLITTATSEIFIVRRNRLQAIRGFCSECKKDVEMLTLDTAVTVSGIVALDVLRHVGTGEIHFQETANGHLLLCRESLGKKFNVNTKLEGENK